MNLIEAFSVVQDPRRAEGRRYPLVALLIIMMMSIACGLCRYREIARFAEANKKDLQRFFGLKIEQMPSHVTFRSIIQRVNFEQLNEAFMQWAKHFVMVMPRAWINVDGKAIGSTVSDAQESYQNFISLVSFFVKERGQVLAVGRLENKKSSEIHLVQEMIKLFDLKDVIFTMDALHCQKKP
jgi:hypothetical protein